MQLSVVRACEYMRECLAHWQLQALGCRVAKRSAKPRGRTNRFTGFKLSEDPHHTSTPPHQHNIRPTTMDLDQLLARTLQAEENEQAQQLSTKQREVLGILQQNQTKAQSVENPQLMATARSLMPQLDAWRQAAREQYDLNRELDPGTTTTSVEDLVVQAMLQWFKHDFFTWVRCCGVVC